MPFTIVYSHKTQANFCKPLQLHVALHLLKKAARQQYLLPDLSWSAHWYVLAMKDETNYAFHYDVSDSAHNNL